MVEKQLSKMATYHR